MKKKLSFEPCSENCPAVTGKPYGSVKYCPMAENTRHKSLNIDDFPNGAYDTRFTDESGKNPYYSHKDYTDCCLNFQCCCESNTGIFEKVAIIQENMPRYCEECGINDECRPYGRNGRWICFNCGMKDENETKNNFASFMGWSD